VTGAVAPLWERVSATPPELPHAETRSNSARRGKVGRAVIGA